MPGLAAAGTPGLMSEWRVIDQWTGRVTIREGEVTAEAGVAPDRVLVTLLSRH